MRFHLIPTFLILANQLICRADGQRHRTDWREGLGTNISDSTQFRIKKNDDLSRNITNLLENLLKNYDSGQHPEYENGVPTVVKSNILVRSMGPFSEQAMDYSMDCYFRQSWKDQRLSFNGPIETLSLSIKMLEGIWKPDTFIYNGKKSYIHTITQPNKLLRIKRDGSILYSVRLTIKAKCPMELREFPMDKQSCPLVLGSYGYTQDELMYVWDEHHGVRFLGDVELSQFDLISSPYRNLSISRKQEDYSVLQVSFNLRRKQGYFLIQIYIPCVLIVVLSWVSFWLNREATSDRVSLGITTVLTLSTLALDSRTDLPKVSYATSLDWFILITFGYCIASLIQFAAVHYFTKVGSGEIYQDDVDSASALIRNHHDGRSYSNQQRGDRDRDALIIRDASFWESRSTQTSQRTSLSTRHQSDESDQETANPTAQNLTGASLVIEMMNDDLDIKSDHPPSERCSRPNSSFSADQQSDKRESCVRQMFYCFTANESFRRKRRLAAVAQGKVINSVSKIDRLSRVLFPLSFFVINFMYWWSYFHKEDVFAWSKLDKILL